MTKQLKLFFFVLAIAFSCNAFSQTVYTTKTGEKYHKSICRYLKYTKKSITLLKAKELGYTACSVCKPTVNNTASVTNEIFAKPKQTTTSNKTTATQCTGKTKAGNRCKRSTKSAIGRCYQH